MVFITKGDFIWVEAAKSTSFAATSLNDASPLPLLSAPIGARVLSAATSMPNGRIVVIDDDGNERRISVDQKIRVMHPTSIQGVEDLVRLEDLHEAAVFRNLFIRFREKLVYTYSGTVLISVNPYKNLPIYGGEQAALYQRHRDYELPPHIYGIAGRAYRNVKQALTVGAVKQNRNQCIIVDGPSGAGKSENVKHILRFLLQQNLVGSASSDGATQRQHNSLCRAQQVIDANLILEAFGNAQTALNNNSSRFGKFIELQFRGDSSEQNGVLDSAQIEHYLLDKSRVVLQSVGERNYHIFYALVRDLSGADKYELELNNVGDYHILSQQQASLNEDNSHIIPLAQIRCAMKSLMFKDAEVTSIFKVLAALLHMGNLKYQVNLSDDLSESVEISDKTNLRKISKLLQLNPENIANALCQKTIISHGECVITSVDALHALDARDALIKGVYARLFNYIVRRCNEALYAPTSNYASSGTKSRCEYASNDDERTSTNGVKRRGSDDVAQYDATPSTLLASRRSSAIGILDMFGFENLTQENAFEQFCINFAAEELQQFYMRQLFKVEQADYEAQHIEWEHVHYFDVDNLAVVDLLAIQPMSIISVINDESIHPEATCDSLLEKLHAHHDLNQFYTRPSSELNKQFGVNHYAQRVTYQASAFLEKNRDYFTTDLVALVESSRFKFLHRLFESRLHTYGSKSNYDISAGSSYGPMSSLGLATKWDENQLLEGAAPAGSCINAITTVGAPVRQTKILQFRRSVESLLQKLELWETHFVRCVKPNAANRELHFDREFVAQQLRSWGVIETTLMQRNGYPIRYDYASFVRKYRMFLPSEGVSHEVNNIYAARHICAVLLGETADYKFGKTKLFLKAEHEHFLDEELTKVRTHYATIAQKIVRGWIQRRRFKRLQRAAVILQKNWRAHFQKAKYEMILRGIARLQAVFRSCQLIQHYNQLKSVVTYFQAHCRGTLIRKALRASDAISGEIFARKDDYARKNRSRIDEERRYECDCCFNDDLRFNTVASTEIGEDAAKLKIYQFEKFAATYFQKQWSASFTRKPLRQPLLRYDSVAEKMAALSIWVCVQRLMRTIPPAAADNSADNNVCNERNKASKSTLMQSIHLSIRKSYSPKQYQNFVHAYSLVYDSYNNENLMNGKEMPNKNSDNTTNEKSAKDNFYADFVANCRHASDQHLIQFIVGHGILSANLRDEILCQICKQLTQRNGAGNFSAAALAFDRAWVLLALCLSCFTPSTKFHKYLLCFLGEHDENKHLHGYNRFVEQKLQRTIKNGNRCQPPSSMEIEMCKSMRNLHLNVTLMDGSVVQLSADSATTSAEICAQVAQRAGLIPYYNATTPSLTVADANNNNSCVSADKNNENGAFGFSLYVALADKVSSLGNGVDHVLDAISQSEQMALNHGRAVTTNNNADAACRLFYRKEVFTPWCIPSENLPATNLVYHQVMRGVKFGEYKCTKEEEIALLCAQQYFIDYGTHVQLGILEGELANYLPENEWNDRNCDVEKWSQIILNILRKKYSKETRETVETVKSQVVSFAMHKWPLLFSRFCEAIKFSGPPLRTNDVVIAVNSHGVNLLDQQDQRLLEFTYPEVTRIHYNRSKRVGADTVTFRILNGDEYTFQSPNARDIGSLVEYFLNGLQKHSKYLIYMRSNSNEKADAKKGLDCKRGDLLIMASHQDGADVLKSENVMVENARTGLHGTVPTACVHILPTITKPSVDLMELFNQHALLSKANLGESENVDGAFNDAVVVYHSHFMTAGVSETFYRPHTLERYASVNFARSCYGDFDTDRRSGVEPNGFAVNKNKSLGVVSDEFATCVALEANVDSAGPKNTFSDELWKWSPRPLKRLLLQNIGAKIEVPSAECLLGYEYVLKYMGDMPSARPNYFLEFTDIIFRSPIKYQVLRDEIYCQLMKQLTENPNPLSEQRGWQLMWLCVGLFAPSASLTKELTQFLKTRYLPLAADSLLRLQKTIKQNAVRKFPPHQVEVEAIQHGTTQIFHKVFLPDNSEIVVDVDSLSMSRDIGARIVSKLHVKSASGFNVFIKIGEKVISMPENEYLFDFIHQLADWMLQNRAQLKQTNHPSQLFSYQLFFMRKLWIDVVPGDDVNADLIFHYHQELPKYLRGYYGVNKAHAAHISALILRAQMRDGHRPPFQQFAHIVADIVPRDLVKAHNATEWKKIISSEFEKLTVKYSADAKIQFLKTMAGLPMYGSAFFEVKQSSDPTLAPRVIVAINRGGVNLFNQDNKEHIVSYPFTAINNWTFGNTYFHLTIGSAMKGSRLLFETTLGYKMDDLLTSYIQTLLSSMEKKRRAEAKIREMEII